MAEPDRLHVVVNRTTGEIEEPDGCPVCGGRDVQVEMLQRELAGYRLRFARLQAEVRELHGVEPEAEQVRTVLGYWAGRVVAEGWWSRAPQCKPGRERWSAVRSRLHDGYDQTYCMTAVEGALMQPKRSVKREWLDASCLFGTASSLEKAYERAQDPRLERVLGLRALPPELVGLDLGQLAEACDCGHLRLWHTPARHSDGSQPCHRCGCEDFDDLQTRAERWLAEQTERAGGMTPKTEVAQAPRAAGATAPRGGRPRARAQLSFGDGA